MSRSSHAKTRAPALDDALRRLFRSLETRATPRSLKVVVQQLDERAPEKLGEGR
jgi:hypothetical protein